MSGRLADEVFRRDVPAGLGRDTLVIFSLHAKEDGSEARPSIALVAAKVGCSRRTVQRWVSYWRERGVLIPIARPRRLQGRANSLPTVYRVDLTPLPLKAGFERRDAHGVASVATDATNRTSEATPMVSPKRRSERPKQASSEQAPREEHDRRGLVLAAVRKVPRGHFAPAAWPEAEVEAVRSKAVELLVGKAWLRRPWSPSVVLRELRDVAAEHHVAEPCPRCRVDLAQLSAASRRIHDEDCPEVMG